MATLAPRALESWTPGSLPDALQGARVVLVCGGDEGGIAAMAADLVRPEGPAARINADDLQPGDLRARLATGGLFGPPSPVRVSGATEKHLAAFSKALDGANPQALLVVEAGDLKKESKLKTFFDGQGTVVQLRPLEGAAPAAALGRALAALNVPLAAGALKGSEGRLPSDRMRLARVAEVLALHALGRGASQCEAEDVAAIVGFEGDVDLTQALMAALDGRVGDALRAYDAQMAAGENPIGLARAWSWKIQRLDDMIRSGLKPAAAVAAARPPVFYGEKDATVRTLGRLGAAGVGFALESLDAAERGVVHGGHPSRIVYERWLAKLASWTPPKGTAR